MGDSDLEFYSREAFKRGEAEGYARAQADIVRMLRDERAHLQTLPALSKRAAEDYELVAHYIDGYINAIGEGMHVGRSG